MKKIAVIVLFLVVAIGLFFLKKNFNIQSNNKVADAVILSSAHNPKVITLKDPVEFTFNLKDISGNPVHNAKIDIEANMNHAGMVPIYASATNSSGSTYKSSFQLTMKGAWILFLTIKMPDGEIVKKQVTFTVN